MSGQVLAVAVSVWMVLFQGGVWVVGQADEKTVVRQKVGSGKSETFTEVPFTINPSEVEGAVSIYTGEESFPATPSGTLAMEVESLYYNVVYLFDGNNSVVAKDVIHPDIKMSLEFNAANSARAEVFDALGLTVLPYAELGKLYDEIDQQKRFPELTSVYRMDKRMRNNIETFRLAIFIADALATTYLD